MTEQLKACKCGGKAIIRTYNNYGRVNCMNCNAVTQDYSPISDAIKAWNTRAIEE